jgi:hypothetical protein
VNYSLFSLSGTQRAKNRYPHLGGATSFRPALEGLEDRVTPASINLPIAIDNLAIDTSGTIPQLVGDVLISGQEAGTLVADLTTTAPTSGDCPILNLELGEIDLNLLGLEVHTSQICLDVTAHEGEGLLGDLLCGLSGGLDLGGILGQLDDVIGQVESFIGELDNLLDEVFSQAMTVTDVFGVPVGGGAAAQQEGDVCDILNLSLAPVDLTLLGLNVHLDNCEGGPITVDVVANPDGGLLGQLLCGLAGGIDTDSINLGGLIDRIDTVIDRLGDLAERLEDLPDLGRRLDNVINQLERLVDRVDDLRDLDRFIDRLDRAIDRLDRIIDRLD